MRILIATPCYQQQINSMMVASLINCILFLEKQGHKVSWYTTSLPALAANRNLCVDVAVEGGFDYLFFWDSDVQIEESDFIPKMIQDMEEYKADVVVLPYRIKEMTVKYALGLDGGAVTKLPPNPFEVTWGATGTMLIKVSLFKQLTHPYFTFIDRRENGKAAFWPEDFYFCDKARKFTRIMADPSFSIYHYGQYGFKNI